MATLRRRGFDRSSTYQERARRDRKQYTIVLSHAVHAQLEALVERGGFGATKSDVVAEGIQRLARLAEAIDAGEIDDDEDP